MSIQQDQADWQQSNVVAGGARLAATGNIGVSPFVITVPLLPTDRSIVVGAGGTLTDCSVIVTGVTTGLVYSANVTNKDISQGPLQFPAYGAIDSNVHVQLNYHGTQTQFYVVATPDEVILAEAAATLRVAAPTGGSVQVTEANGGGEGQGSIVLSNSNAQLLPAPAGGQIRIVDLVTTADNSVTGDVLLFAGVFNGPLLADWSLSATPSQNPVVHPNFHLTTALWVQWSGATAIRITAAYHDVNLPS